MKHVGSAGIWELSIDFILILLETENTLLSGFQENNR
jgi:hypothetical protein